MVYSTGLNMGAVRGGNEAYATHDGFIKEYANGSGGSKSTVAITTTLDPTAVPNDTIVFNVNSGVASFPVTYTVPSPKPTGAALQSSILAALTSNIRVGGLGTWTSDGTKVDFTSLEVGQRVRVSATFTPGKATVAIAQSGGVQAGQKIARGRLVVTDPSVSQPAVNTQWDTRLDIAFLPTQNLNLVGSTQKFAGVTLDDAEEMNYAVGGYPSMNGQADQAIQPNVRAKLSGFVSIDLETPFNEGLGAIPALLYRAEADAPNGFTELGTFSLTAGAGLYAVPVKTRITAIENGGTTLFVDFAKA